MGGGARGDAPWRYRPRIAPGTYEILYPSISYIYISSYILIYLQDRDFEPLHEGAPLFESLDGEIVTYDGSLGPTVVPIFINEAAYYYAASGLGIMLTEAVEWPVPADLG